MKNKMLSQIRLMYPGLRLKRWLILVPIGILFILFGIILALNDSISSFVHYFTLWFFDKTGVNADDRIPRLIICAASILAGLLLIYTTIRQIAITVFHTINPSAKHSLAEEVYEKHQLAAGQRITVIGGGTGLSTLLRGLKEYSSNITAIVSVTDNGGSTGRLRKEQDIPAPGDIRNCIIALADKGKDMEDLFQYRFNTLVPELDKHSFGNLFIATLAQLTGSFETAVERFADILAIRGKVYPCSGDTIDLIATFEDGTEITGETDIVEHNKPIKSIRLSNRNAKAPKGAVDAIMNADIVILGPGSLYTSIIPNLLVKDIRAALIKTKAPKLLICNVMTQVGESDGLTAAGHCKTILEIIGRKHILDYAIVNTDQPDNEQAAKYREAGQYYVKADLDEIVRLGIKPISGSYINTNNTLKHDSQKLAKAIVCSHRTGMI